MQPVYTADDCGTAGTAFEYWQAGDRTGGELTTHVHLAQRFRIRRVTHLLLRNAFVEWTGTPTTFIIIICEMSVINRNPPQRTCGFARHPKSSARVGMYEYIILRIEIEIEDKLVACKK